MRRNSQTKALFPQEEGLRFVRLGKPPAEPEKAPRKKAFASSIKQSGPLTASLTGQKSFCQSGGSSVCVLWGGRCRRQNFRRVLKRLPVIMPYRAYSGRLLSQRLRIQGSSGEQRLHGRRGAAGHFGVVLRREMDAVLTQDGKLPCIEIAAAEAPGNAGVNGGQLF